MARLKKALTLPALGFLLQAAPVQAAVTYLGRAAVDANLTDASGLTGSLENGTPRNLAGGFGSAIAWAGGNRFLMQPDRGPGDGTTTYEDRAYEWDIVVTPAGGGSYDIILNLVGTTLYRRAADATFYTGSSAAFDTTNSPDLRLDPEGIRVSKGAGSFFVSDEYGPFVYEFDRATGKRIRAFNVPAKFLVRTPNANGADELPPANTAGRQSNRGMEGLALSPDGSKLFGLMQSPLIQDGGLDAGNKRVGTNCRILEIDIATNATSEYLYQLAAANLGVSEILAINSHQMLVIERDGRGLGAGNAAVTKRLYKIDITGATDISAVTNLPTTGTPVDVAPVSKELFLDVLAASGLPGAQFPEKIEGLAFGPDLSDGRHLLLITSDNDFFYNLNPPTPTFIFAFGIDPADLPTYEP